MSNAIANQLFLAYLGRPADTQWRNTTGTLLNGAAPSVALQTAFYNAAVADGVFATTDSPSVLVNKIFNQLFGFNASTFEQTQWGNLITTGVISAQSAAWTIFSSYLGATNVPDSYKIPAQSKLVAADAYVTQLTNDAAANAALSQAGSAAATSARTFLSTITTQAQAATAVTNIATTVSSVGSGSTTGSTFTLTSGTNTFTGTSSGDTFNADTVNEGGVANVQTLNTNDNLNGGSGNDTLNATIGASVTPAALTSIETINVTATGAATLGLVNATGVTTLSSSGNAGALTVTGVQAALSTINLSNTNQNLTVTNAAGLTGTTDAITLNLSSVTGGAFELGSGAANGYETLTINSGGAVANTLTSVSDGATATSLTTINVTGSRNLTITNSLDATVTTVNASTFTGNLNVTQTSTVNATITGGSGNDTIVLGAAYTTSDVVNGGAGTDTLSLTTATAAGVTATQSNLTSIETISVSDALAGNFQLSAWNGATTVRLAAGIDGTSRTLTLASGNSVSIGADNGNAAHTFTISGTGTTDVLNLSLDSGVDFATNALFTGVETLNIATASTAGTVNVFGGTTALTATAATESIIITGATAITFTGAVTADVINASALTGVLTVTAGPATAATITGGSAADVIVGSTAADIIIGGAGADFITNTADGANTTAGDVLTGGAGFDTFTLIGSSASAGNYNGAPNITDFTVGTTATTTDLIRLSSTNGSYSAGLSVDGNATGASGSVGLQSVAQNGAAIDAGTTNTVEFFKLTTGVAFTTNLQSTFNAAIGTGTVTNLTAGVYAGSLYDTTNNVMVIFEVDVNTGAATTTLETADTVRLIGTISMTATDYASISAIHFADFLA